METRCCQAMTSLLPARDSFPACIEARCYLGTTPLLPNVEACATGAVLPRHGSAMLQAKFTS